MPSENMSLRRSSGSPRHCSGDMYANLPLSVPAARLARCAAPPSRCRSRRASPRRRSRSACSTATRRDGRCRAACRRRRALVRVVQRRRSTPATIVSACVERDRLRCGAARVASSCAQVLAVHVLHREEVARRPRCRCRRPARCSGGGAARRAAPRRGTSSTKRRSRRELGADPLEDDELLEALDPAVRARDTSPPCRRSRGAPGSSTSRTVREASTSPSGLHPFRSIVNCLPSTGQRAPRPTSRCQIAPPHPLRICLILVLAVRGKRHA